MHLYAVMVFPGFVAAGPAQVTINPTPAQRVAMILTYKDMVAETQALFKQVPGELEPSTAAVPGETPSDDAVQVDFHSHRHPWAGSLVDISTITHIVEICLDACVAAVAV